jgi:hypothetical protein
VSGPAWFGGGNPEVDHRVLEGLSQPSATHNDVESRDGHGILVCRRTAPRPSAGRILESTVRLPSRFGRTRRLLVATLIDAGEVALPPTPQPLDTPLAPLPERRSAHRFEVVPDHTQEPGACVTCGYPETGHLAFTDPEREMIVALVNQPQPQPLMRRSILRKLSAGWRSRGARAKRPAPRS